MNRNSPNLLINKSTNKKCLHSIIAKAKTVTKINPKHIVIDKVIRGDAGDNIFPIILKKSSSNPDKKYRVAQKDINDSIDVHNSDEVKTYLNGILTSKSYAGKVDKSLEDIIAHFNYNMKLVALERESYPDEVLKIMENYTEYTVNKNLQPVTETLENSHNDLFNLIDSI